MEASAGVREHGPMRYVRYAGETLLTGDDIAEALVQLAEAAAEHRCAARIRIPIQLVDGGVGQATLLLGPASQILTTPGPRDVEELVDEPAVAEIDERIWGFERRHDDPRERDRYPSVGRWYDDL